MASDGQADVAAGAGPVVDDDLLAEPLAELGRDDAHRGVGRAAGREGDDHADRLGRPGGLTVCACAAALAAASVTMDKRRRARIMGSSCSALYTRRCTATFSSSWNSKVFSSIGQVAEQILFHAVGDPVGLAHQRGALAASGRCTVCADRLSLRVRVMSSRSPSLSQTIVRRGADTSSASDICRCVTCGFDGDQHQDREVEAAQLEGLADALVEDLEARDRRLGEVVAEKLVHPAVVEMPRQHRLAMCRWCGRRRAVCTGLAASTLGPAREGAGVRLGRGFHRLAV